MVLLPSYGAPMADHLIQKKGESTWYVRLAVPADVRAAMGGKTVLTRSLKTGLRGEAMVRRLAVLTEWKAAFDRAKGKRAARGDTWKDPIASIAQGMAQATRKLKTDVALGEADDQTSFAAEEIQALYEGLFDDSPEGRLRREKADRVYAMSGIEGELANVEFAKEMALEVIAKAIGVTQELNTSEQAEAKTILNDPKAHKPKSPITDARIKTFREFRESRGGAPKHIDTQCVRMKALSKFLKDEELPLDFDTVDKWLKSLNRAPNTLSQYLMAGGAFWQWAAKYDSAWRVDFRDQANPFIGHELPQGGGRETSGSRREAYSTEQIAKLHAGAIEDGNNPLADLILIGAYTGFRIEEICQLKSEHVISPDGIQSLNIVSGKNKSAIRVVPVHPKLKPVIERLVADSKDTYLVPTASKDQYGKRSHNISKAFGLLKTRLGFGPLHVFHGLRNTFVTELVRADVADHLIKELTGHKTRTITHDIYSKGGTAKQKLAAIRKLPVIPVREVYFSPI